MSVDIALRLRRAALLCATAVMSVTGIAAAQSAPIEAYGRLPTVEDVTISPSGMRFALMTSDANGRQLQIHKTDDLSRVRGLNVGDSKIVGLDWADENNLLFVYAKATSVAGLQGPRREWWLAFDYDIEAKKLHPLLSGNGSAMNIIERWPQARRVGDKTMLFLTGLSFPNNRGVLTLYRQNLVGASTLTTFTGEEDTSDLLINTTGTPVARVDYNEQSGQWSLLSRSRGGSWHAIHREMAPIDTPDLVGFGRTEETLIVEQDDENSTHYREIPIAGGEWSPRIAALDGARLIEDPIKRTVIGGETVEDTAVRYTFLDPKDQALWDRVSKAFPGETVRLASWSDDRSKILLRVEGPTNGAAYFRLDVKSRRADWIANEYANIGPDDLGEVRFIRYKAADGREIPAYLTLPHLAKAKGLPLVLLVHGGPAARDDPGFDWWAQAIASLGYAVLQPQFRGSAGFGMDLLTAGYGEWGRKMQTDLSDGVQYLADQGIIDPNQVCITGASYGGYAAMAGVTLQSGIYKCAVAVAGVSDLKQMLLEDSDKMGGSRNSTLRFWQRFIGAKGMNDPMLDRLSPARHADNLSVPLLLIHGTIDTVVPFNESKAMLNAARRAGKSVQLVTLTGEDHNLSRSATRLQMLEAMADFLKANLPTKTETVASKP